MGFGRADIRLHTARHRLAAQHQVGDFPVHELDKPGINLLAVGHREGLDINLVLNARNHHLVLRGVGNLVGQPLTVHITLRNRLAVDDGLAIGV